MTRLTFTRLAYFIAFIFSSYLIQAQQPWLPREASPAASVSQTVGISTITVNYSRPSVRGREVWGTWFLMAGIKMDLPLDWNHPGVQVQMKIPYFIYHMMQK